MAAVRIGILDDHDLVRTGLAHLVQRPGWQVTWSGSSVEQFEADCPGVDVLLLDLALGNTEPETAAVARIVASGTKVLVVSALASDAAIRRMTYAGVSGFVAKHDSHEQLVEAIETVTAGDVWVTRELASSLLDSGDAVELSGQERRALGLYASGLKIDSVARRMNLSPHTVVYYLRRAREKLAESGYPAPTRVDMYRQATRLGLLDEPTE